jgi:hypothetical protein
MSGITKNNKDMYNEIIKGILDILRENNPPCIEGKDVKVIGDVVTHALNGNGECIGTMDTTEFIGVILNEGDVVHHFKYNFEDGEFEPNP